MNQGAIRALYIGGNRGGNGGEYRQVPCRDIRLTLLEDTSIYPYKSKP